MEPERGLAEVRERFTKLGQNNIPYLMTCAKQATVSPLIVFPILTAQRPVLGRLPSAVCSVQSLGLHYNVALRGHLLTFKTSAVRIFCTVRMCMVLVGHLQTSF